MEKTKSRKVLVDRAAKFGLYIIVMKPLEEPLIREKTAGWSLKGSEYGGRLVAGYPYFCAPEDIKWVQLGNSRQLRLSEEYVDGSTKKMKRSKFSGNRKWVCITCLMM